MSAEEIITEQDEQHEEAEAISNDERKPVYREYEVELTEGDGRTIDARVLPYNMPTLVADPPDFTPYTEEWLPGAFDRQTRAADRVKVWLNFEHEGGLRGIVGHGLSLTDVDGFLRGTFRVHDNADGDKALQLVADKLLTGMSVEAIPLRSRRVEGVVQRIRAHLDKVSLCRFPAYKDAQIVAVRTEAVELQKIVLPTNEELESRLAELGVQAISGVALSRKAWDNSVERFTEEEYARSCLIDRGGDGSAFERCALPVLEPDGTLNVNALAPTVVALQGPRTALAGVTAEMKAAAARKLVRYYRKTQMTVPASLIALAREERKGASAPVYRITITRKPWDGSASRFTDEQYQRSCLIDRGGPGTPKERCALPVLEPDGTLNVNALGAAAARINQVENVARADKARAARRLVSYYRQAKMEPPESLVALAHT